MSDTQTTKDDRAELVQVILNLPAGLLQAYERLVEQEMYPNRESALLHATRR